MKIVFMTQQFTDLALETVWNETFFRKRPVQQLDNIVAFDMNNSIENQGRHQTTGIDAKIPGRELFLFRKINDMRFPGNVF